MLLISLLVFSVGWVGVAGGMTTGGVMGLSFGWGLVSTVVFSLFSDDVFWGSSAGLLSAVVLSDGLAGWVGAAGGMITGGVVGLSSDWGLVSAVVFSLFSDDVFWDSSAGLLSAVVLPDGSTGLLSAGLLPFSGTVVVGLVEGVCPLLPQADKAKAMIRAGHTRVNNEFIIVSY